VVRSRKIQHRRPELMIWSIGTLLTLSRFTMPEWAAILPLFKENVVSRSREMTSQSDPYIMASVTAFEAPVIIPTDNGEFSALIASLKDLAIQIITKILPTFLLRRHLPSRTLNHPHSWYILFHQTWTLILPRKQKLLEVADIAECANLVLTLLTKELQVADWSNKYKIR